MNNRKYFNKLFFSRVRLVGYLYDYEEKFHEILLQITPPHTVVGPDYSMTKTSIWLRAKYKGLEFKVIYYKNRIKEDS